MNFILRGLIFIVAACCSLESFSFPFRPLEMVRYRSGACEISLSRTTKALLKERTYQGCFKNSLAALQRPDSRLSKKFQRTYDLKNQRYEANYDQELKPVFEQALKDRLGILERKKGLFAKRLVTTEEGRAAFQHQVQQFCRKGEVLESSYGQERLNRLISGLEQIDLYKMFEGFRRTLHVAEGFKKKDPDMFQGINKLRIRFLSVLSQIAIFKKVLAGKKLREGVLVDDVMRRAVDQTQWIESYHQLKVHGLMSPVCQRNKSVCDRTFKEMDLLASVLQSFDDLSRACWTKKSRQP